MHAVQISDTRYDLLDDKDKSVMVMEREPQQGDWFVRTLGGEIIDHDQYRNTLFARLYIGHIDDFQPNELIGHSRIGQP